LINRISINGILKQLGLVSLLALLSLTRCWCVIQSGLVSLEYEAALKEIIRKNNVFVLDTLDALLDLV